MRGITKPDRNWMLRAQIKKNPKPSKYLRMQQLLELVEQALEMVSYKEIANITEA